MKHRNGLSVVLFVSALGCGGRLSGSATGLSEAGATVSGSSSGGETGSSSGGSGSSTGSGSGATDGADASPPSTPAPCACPGGCCDTTNTCYAGVIDQLCGQSGGACIDCAASGRQCNQGVCGVLPSCNATTCPGCCDMTDTCQVGTDPTACGTGGENCTACASDQVCSEGACVVGGSSGGGPCDIAACPACVLGLPACCPTTGACGCSVTGLCLSD
jgi:hypothetical protein